jgi:hypothetical protein
MPCPAEFSNILPPLADVEELEASKSRRSIGHPGRKREGRRMARAAATNLSDLR